MERSEIAKYVIEDQFLREALRDEFNVLTLLKYEQNMRCLTR